MRRRFAELTPLQALQAAIAIERRNTVIYRNLAETFESYDGKLGHLFTAMAEEEAQHGLELAAYLQRRFPGEHPTGEADAEVDEVIEAPDLHEPEAFIFDNLTVQQAIEMAERTEADAYDFYQTTSQQLTDEGLRVLCQHMAEVEAQHLETFICWKKSGRIGAARA